VTAESAPGVVAAVYMAGHPENFIPTLRSLEENARVPVVVGGQSVDLTCLPADLFAYSLPGVSPAEMVQRVWERHRADVLLVSDAVLVPPDFLSGAQEIVARDIRAATVSFLSNTAAYLSFPATGKPMLRILDGHDELSITRRLRSLSPVLDPVPIPVAAGACSLLTAGALSAVGPLADGPDESPAELVQDFSLLAARRGFIPFLDAGTFYARPTDLSVEPTHRLESREAVGDWAAQRHPHARPLVRDAATPESPLGLAMSCARAKVLGLRVVVDGTCFGATEMGTQVATLALIRALAARDDVAEVQVRAPEGIPAYGSAIASEPKVRVVGTRAVGSEVEPADVAHRPYQPDDKFLPGLWRRSAGRLVVTVLDLIAYQIGSYHEGPGDWFKYRSAVQKVLGSADGVVAISQDVRRHIEMERLPVEPSRLVVVPVGTDHLSGEEPGRMPRELLSRGFAAEEFVLTLGANFSHKNRDLAMRAHALLREQRPDLALVLAGTHVPYGSSRVSEARVPRVEGVYDLPDTTSQERNWLLRHASVVLYPTSAEGFGLVPFEAARFGTPTVHVGFGPLRELGGEPPVAPVDWDPRTLAGAVEALVADPELARAQVAAVLAAGEKYAWTQTAADLAALYRAVLARVSVVTRQGAQAEVEALKKERTFLEEQLTEIRSTWAFRTASRLWAFRQAFRP
jgi:glycosyltransferase involved in cell wall biosynthesis